MAIAVALAGCGRVFGLDTVPLPQPYDVTGSLGYQRVEQANLDHRTQVIRELPTGVQLAVSYAQTLDEPVAFGGDGTYAFTPIGPYALAIRWLDTPLVQIDGDEDAAAPVFDLTDIGRLNASPLPAPSPTLSFQGVTGWASGDTPVIESESLYTETVLPTLIDASKPQPVAWSQAGRLGTTFGMLESSRDLLYVTVHRATNSAAPTDVTVNTVSGYLSVPPNESTLQPGDNPITGAIGPNDLQVVCVHVLAHRADELAHVRDSLEVAPITNVVRWEIRAVPAPDVAPAGGALVAYENANLPELQAVHEVPILQFGNPFAQQPELVASFGARTTYLVTAPGATAASIQAGTQVFYRPKTGTCPTAPLLELGVTVAIPNAPVLDQYRLTMPQTVALSGDFTELTWNEAAAGTIATDAFHLVIYEIANVGGATQLTVVRRVFTSMPHTRLPTAMFVPGHEYVVRVESRIGYPGAAHGDYATISYPFGVGAVLSAPFTIATP